MFPQPEITYLLAKERIEGAIREAEKARLIQAVKGHGQSREWLRSVVQILKNPRTRVVKRGTGKPPWQSPTTAPSPCWKTFPGS
jgi:hypothetical protein